MVAVYVEVKYRASGAISEGVVDADADVDADVEVDVDADVDVNVVGLTASEDSDKVVILSDCEGKPAYRYHCSPLSIEAKCSFRAASRSKVVGSKGSVHEDCSSNLVQ